MRFKWFLSGWNQSLSDRVIPVQICLCKSGLVSFSLNLSECCLTFATKSFSFDLFIAWLSKYPLHRETNVFFTFRQRLVEFFKLWKCYYLCFWCWTYRLSVKRQWLAVIITQTPQRSEFTYWLCIPQYVIYGTIMVGPKESSIKAHLLPNTDLVAHSCRTLVEI